MQITSPKNPHLQEIRKAASSGRPTAAGLTVAEGPHLLQEAARSPWTVESIVMTGEAGIRFAGALRHVEAEIIEVPDRAFAGMAATEHSQGILALLRPPKFTWSDLVSGSPLLVVLDAIQDPGNAGTMVRSAEAFGATGVVLLRGSVRVANGKFLRATAGSLFHLPYLENFDPEEFLRACAGGQVNIYALSAGGETDIAQADLGAACALVVGNEGAGVSLPITRAAASVRVRVRRVESLNAGVACSIALYEASRQRSAV